MPVRVAINGFGRIGRLVLRAAAESKRKDIEFDTTHLTPEGILEPFLEAVRPQVDARDLIFLDSLRK